MTAVLTEDCEMRLLRPLSVSLAILSIAACAPPPIEQAPATSTVVVPAPAPAPASDPTMVPLTANAAAAEHFRLGLRDFDMARVTPAREHFQAAITADPSFALGHLYRAFTAPSLADFRAHLDHAVERAGNASVAEQLMIRSQRRALDNDLTGQLELVQQLVQAVPANARAQLNLAGVQSSLGRVAEARQTMLRAIQLAPRFAVAHLQLAGSYLTVEPRDLAQAEAHARHAVDLEPNEATTHDALGDVYRAQNRLDLARAEYTRMAELDATSGLGFQQRGHVNSFLGNFTEARADYDRAISLAEPNVKPSFMVYRALVNMHAGDAAGAEQELERVLTAIDGMTMPDPAGARIFALSNLAQIALHHGHVDVAARAVDRLRPLLQQQGEAGGTPEFRRGTEATIAIWEGFLAARRGQYDAARAKAADYMRLREAERNPRKNESAHELLGLVDLMQRNYAAAAAHFEQGDPNDIYVTYHRALALEGAGRTAEARALFRRVADVNFNSAGLALVKKDAARKAG